MHTISLSQNRGIREDLMEQARYHSYDDFSYHGKYSYHEFRPGSCIGGRYEFSRESQRCYCGYSDDVARYTREFVDFSPN